MSSKRILRVLALAAWALAVWPATWSGAETAEVALDKYGWWNANQALPEDPSGGLLPPVAVPAPPGAPEDGLYVESGPDGSPLAISGVSFYTGGGVDSTLTLALAEGSTGEGATLAACPASGGWDAAQNGRWDDRPTYDPATCGLLGSAGSGSVTFSVPAAAHEPASAYLSLVIVPAEGSGAFSVSFDPPSSASLVTSAPASSGAGAGESESGSDSASPAFQPGTVTLAEPSFSAPPAAAVEVPAGSGATSDGGAPAAPIAAAPPLTTDPVDRTTQIVAAGTLVAIGCGLWFLSSRPQRPPRLLGSLGAGETAAVAVPVAVTGRARGLGRFSRTRNAPPNPI